VKLQYKDHEEQKKKTTMPRAIFNKSLEENTNQVFPRIE